MLSSPTARWAPSSRLDHDPAHGRVVALGVGQARLGRRCARMVADQMTTGMSLPDPPFPVVLHAVAGHAGQ